MAALLNGLARFALMFVFVLYFQGVQGHTPVMAGVKLAPLAIGMLIASPVAGVWAGRHVLGALVSLARPKQEQRQRITEVEPARGQVVSSPAAAA